MKTNFLIPLVLVLLSGCSAEKPVYDAPKAIKRFAERDALLLAVDSTMSSGYNQDNYTASLANLRNSFVDYKEAQVKPSGNEPPPPPPPKELTIEQIFQEAIDVLGPRSVLISPTTRILVTEEGSRRVGHVIEWTDTQGGEFKVTLVEIATGSYTLEYKGTKQRFPLRR